MAYGPMYQSVIDALHIFSCTHVGIQVDKQAFYLDFLHRVQF